MTLNPISLAFVVFLLGNADAKVGLFTSLINTVEFNHYGEFGRGCDVVLIGDSFNFEEDFADRTLRIIGKYIVGLLGKQGSRITEQLNHPRKRNNISFCLLESVLSNNCSGLERHG